MAEGQATPATLTVSRTPVHAGESSMRHHADALARLLGDRAEVRFGKHDRMLYATDASIYQVEPLGVVIPKDIDAAADALRYCVEHRIPVLPRGGGTSLAGQGVNEAVVIDFSAHCRDLEWVRHDTRDCFVQPGITIDDLNDELRKDGHQLFFAPDPATARHCNIGGAIGNNAAGTRSIIYGRTSESIEAVRVLLATPESRSSIELAEGACLRDPIARKLGEGVIDIVLRHEQLIRERFPKTLRRNAGYALDMMLEDIDAARREGVDPLEKLNLAHLICGSEGTLAVTVGATLKLHPVPKAKGLAVLGFDSLEEAIACVVPILPLKPSAVELLDDMLIGLARENTEYAAYVNLMPQPVAPAHTSPERGRVGQAIEASEAKGTRSLTLGARSNALAAVLYVEFFSTTGPDEIQSKFAELRTLITSIAPNAGFAAYTGPTEMANALKLRKAGEPLLHGIPGKRKPLGFVEDNAVPVERLSEFVREFKKIVNSKGTTAAYWAHASVGVLHVRPLLNLRDADDRVKMEEIAVEVADLAKRLGGVMSGEHGDGRVRGPLLERYFGPELMNAFREVKALFDPLNLLNPGNIVAPQDIHSIHERTRPRPMGHDLHAPHVETYFDYTKEDGFDHAVELCNGAGVCRKKTGGTMCPSYMGTMDERHSTRGRGNALRLAITGQLAQPDSRLPTTDSRPAPLWNDPETLETLNLCLSCKACKTECPSNVDISKYKAEYLAQSYRAVGGVPLKARAFGNVRALNRLGSMFAPISTWVANSMPARLIVDRVLGLAPKRALPAFAPSLFRQAKRRLGTVPPRSAPVVILYADCFTTYNEPGIGLATIRVLEACGYRVEIVDAGCCARAAISTGILEDATRMASTTAANLLRAVDSHHAVAVVVCEPSCLSAIKDDWQTLKLGTTKPDLSRLSKISHLPEDFLDKHWESHPNTPRFKGVSAQEPILLHAHCHQKALWGAESSARFLRRIVGDRLKVLDTGCCGMAGSFGYTADRYDLSMKIGELTLFPALRASPNAIVVAPGTSCRHQIHDGVEGRKALHPMELAAAMLAE
ncbi:MAG: FAD-binding and (Fe-S)-binding domain-containing protein [Phycisphaerales bacterium]